MSISPPSASILLNRRDRLAAEYLRGYPASMKADVGRSGLIFPALLVRPRVATGVDGDRLLSLSMPHPRFGFLALAVSALLYAPLTSRAATADANTTLESIVAIMKSGMSPERRGRLAQVHLALAGRNETHVAVAVRLIRETLGDTAANAAAKKLAIADAKGSELAAKEKNPRTAAPSRGLCEYVDGHAFCVIGEENVTAVDWDEHGSRARRIAIHEFSHAVEHFGLTEAEHSEYDRLWAENARRRGVSVAKAGNKKEFFAESTEAWYGVHQRAPLMPGMSTIDFIDTFPEMALFLQRIYGPPR